MKKCTVIKHQGIDIVFIDLAQANSQQTVEIFAEARKIIEAFPKHSVRIFTDGTGAVYNRESMSALKDFTTHNTPYVKASAVIGAEGLRALAVNTAAAVTGRQIRAFATQIEALDWLAAAN